MSAKQFVSAKSKPAKSSAPPTKATLASKKATPSKKTEVKGSKKVEKSKKSTLNGKITKKEKPKKGSTGALVKVSTGGIKKPHRWRSGTVALRDIKKYQIGVYATKFLIPAEVVRRIVKRKIFDQHNGEGVRLSAEALAFFRVILEDEGTKQMAIAQIQAVNCDRVTIFARDLISANKIREIHPGRLDGSCNVTISHNMLTNGTGAKKHSLLAQKSHKESKQLPRLTGRVEEMPTSVDESALEKKTEIEAEMEVEGEIELDEMV